MRKEPKPEEIETLKTRFEKLKPFPTLSVWYMKDAKDEFKSARVARKIEERLNAWLEERDAFEMLGWF